ncbi:hypothetical protein [Lichenicoccus sp.]|uniref:hypothetical protein n=1 Tax=Lichenicoccus sp. TaxID=2781899 RepID=UPI003D104AFA
MRSVLLAFVAVATVVATPAEAVPAEVLHGSWSGTLRTLQGTCPTLRPSTLVIHAGEVSFAPADGVLVLEGKVKPDGQHLYAQLQLPGVDHKPVPMVFDGHSQDKTIVGLYGTPSCRAEVLLLRARDRPLQRALGR